MAAQQSETAYRPVPEDISLTETVSIKHTRKVARYNTVKYQWRVLQLLQGAERPSYAGLRVDLLERADGELMLRYLGEPVHFQEGEPPPRPCGERALAAPSCRMSHRRPVAWQAATWMRTSGDSWRNWSHQWRSDPEPGRQPRKPPSIAGPRKKNRCATCFAQ